MMNRYFSRPSALRSIAILVLVCAALAATRTAQAMQTGATTTLSPGTYAVFHTSDGDFMAQLLPAAAPQTVENFIGLATGKKPWIHPVTRAQERKPLYDNTTIYQVEADTLVRGGDPINRGHGSPGYTLPMEIAPGADFSTSGVLAMETAGPVANGSRWFITLMPIPDFTGRNTVFGRVVAGIDVVSEISRKPTRRERLPLEPALVTSIEIVEIDTATPTQASFSTEDGRQVLSLQRLAPPTPPPAAPVTTDTATTNPDVTTSITETDAATSAL